MILEELLSAQKGLKPTFFNDAIKKSWTESLQLPAISVKYWQDYSSSSFDQFNQESWITWTIVEGSSGC